MTLPEFHDADRKGEIITFYSFKGGVGRTMALSNVAYLAAANGMRVLVMDWDLEAPGLSYYFRGVVEPATLNRAKEAEGVLHILWEWVSEITSAKDSSKKMKEVFSNFDSGVPFRKRVTSLLDDRHLALGGRLDHIGAGGGVDVRTPEPCSYEMALARFPWGDFFEKHVGGFASSALREWATSNYDLIFIDSRTGLAEAAGICTMQLADRVAMCFVLNRQNIDGTARIASAIRRARKENVKIYAVPMRVAREGTVEESEARARAVSELSRVGGFEVDELHHQLQALSVKQADNVPFYETLAQIIADDPTLDPLTLNYARLGKELTGYPMVPQPITSATLALIRARLQPRTVTYDFIQKLSLSEPLRACEELNRLIGSAQEFVSENSDLDPTYIQALVKAGFSIIDPEFTHEALEVQRGILDLLRMLEKVDEHWALLLAESIQSHLSFGSAYIDLEEELVLLEEMEIILRRVNTIEARFRQISTQRRIVQVYLHQGMFETALQINMEISSQVLNTITAPLLISEEQKFELYSSEVELLLQRGNILEIIDSYDDAIDAYLNCIEHAELIGEIAASRGKAEFMIAAGEAHIRLALISSNRISTEARISHTLSSAQTRNTPSSALRFVELAALFKDESQSENFFKFLKMTVGTDSSQRYSSSFARSYRTASTFFAFAADFGSRFGPNFRESSDLMNNILKIVDGILLQLAKRRALSTATSLSELLVSYGRLEALAADKTIDWAGWRDAQSIIKLLSDFSRRPTINQKK